MEIQKGIAATLRVPNAGGDPVALTGSPTVTITRDSDGSTVVKDAATSKVTSPETYWKYELAGSKIPEVDLLTVIWTDGTSSYTQYVEVVGGFLCSVSDIKEKLNESAEDLPEQWKMERERERATKDIEEACWDAFRHRYAKETFSGDRNALIELDNRNVVKILSVEVDGDLLSESEVEELTITRLGVERNPGQWPGEGWPFGANNITIAYIYGHDAFPSARGPVRDLAADYLIDHPTDWQERATSYSDTNGNHYRMVTAGEKGAKFNVPSANAFVGRHGSARFS